MAKSTKSKRRTQSIGTFTGRGPVARKVISTAREFLQSKVTCLDSWKRGKLNAEKLEESILDADEFSDMDMAHATYCYAQNKLSILIEQMIELPPLRKLATAYDAAMDEYTPDYPPMSPVTKSYFTCWGSFDLATQGAKKETMTSIAVDFCRFIQVDQSLLSLYENMEQARMGIYRHVACEGEFVHLIELVTHKKIKAVRTTSFEGQPGELWFVRILPPLFDSLHMDHHVIFNTPYVLIANTKYDHGELSVEEQWLSYFDRVLPETGIEHRVEAYEHLMHYGLTPTYWLEFIFLAYINFIDGAILLGGYPDIRESLPHGELSSPLDSGMKT
jgi:hypothetical protein